MMPSFPPPMKRVDEDELLRMDSPALQDAWERYQVVLALVKAEQPESEVKDEPNTKKKKRKKRVTTWWWE